MQGTYSPCANVDTGVYAEMKRHCTIAAVGAERHWSVGKELIRYLVLVLYVLGRRALSMLHWRMEDPLLS